MSLLTVSLLAWDKIINRSECVLELKDHSNFEVMRDLTHFSFFVRLVNLARQTLETYIVQWLKVNRIRTFSISLNTERVMRIQDTQCVLTDKHVNSLSSTFVTLRSFVDLNKTSTHIEQNRFSFFAVFLNYHDLRWHSLWLIDSDLL